MIGCVHRFLKQVHSHGRTVEARLFALDNYLGAKKCFEDEAELPAESLRLETSRSLRAVPNRGNLKGFD